MVDTMLQKELRRRMGECGYNQKSLARAAGLNETAVRDILKGRSRNPRIDTLDALARTLGCSVPALTGRRDAPPPQDKTVRIDVIGAVEAGARHRSLVRPVDEWYQIDVPKDRRFFNRPRFALEVRGRAAERFYKRGDVVVCVKPDELSRQLTVGDKLVMQLTHNDSEFEFVIGEFQMDDDGQTWYWLGSGDGGRMSKSGAPDIETVAVVVGGYKHE